MKRFIDFQEEIQLKESLDTPIEFYLTDDTLIPTRVYGVFQLDGEDYGMSLEQSDFQGIYILSFYRILSKQKRLWSFKKPNHIRPGLSTLIKFAEAAVPFVKSRLKGIIVKVPGDKAPRYIRFAERMIKKSYIRSFKMLPVTKNPDKKKYNWENIFMSRIGVSASSVFVDKKFKDYDFSDSNILTHEMSADIKPAKKPKTTVKLEPSKKYVVKGLEVTDITIDSDIFEKITSVEKAAPPPLSNDEEEKEKEFKELTKDLKTDEKQYVKRFKDVEDQKIVVKAKNLLKEDSLKFIAGLIKYIDKTSKDSNFLSKLKAATDTDNFSSIFYDSNSIIPTGIKQILKQNNIDIDYTSFWSDVEHFWSSERQKKVLDIVDNMSEEEEKSMSKIIEDFNNAHKNIKPLSDFSSLREVLKTNVDPNDLVATIPGYGEYSYDMSFEQLSYGDNSDNIKHMDIKKYLQYDLDYYSDIQTKKGYKHAISYTGTAYESMNRNLRNVFNEFSNDGLKENLTSSVKGLARMFDDMKPLPDSLWVFRGTILPVSIRDELDAGADFMDPGFLSTSIRPSMGSGSDKFRIFVPKGSRVIPILDQSKHSSENEIILPPMSAIKIIRIDKYPQNKVLYTGIFIGSLYKNFTKSLKDNSTNESNLEMRLDSLLEVNKKETTKKYNADDKYAGTKDEKTLKNALKYAKAYYAAKKK